MHTCVHVCTSVHACVRAPVCVRARVSVCVGTWVCTQYNGVCSHVHPHGAFFHIADINDRVGDITLLSKERGSVDNVLVPRAGLQRCVQARVWEESWVPGVRPYERDSLDSLPWRRSLFRDVLLNTGDCHASACGWLVRPGKPRRAARAAVFLGPGDTHTLARSFLCVYLGDGGWGHVVWGMEGIPGASGEKSRECATSRVYQSFISCDRRAGRRKGVQGQWGLGSAQDATLARSESHAALTCRGFKGPAALQSRMPRCLPDSCTPSTPRPPSTCCPHGPALLAGSLPPLGQHLAGTAPPPGPWLVPHSSSFVL